VVYSVGRKSIGLVVDRIHDIVDTALTARRDGGRSGVVCSVVIQKVVTEVLDVEQVIRSYDPSLLEETEAA
jgi:two-component system chemotaxis sensor kinase CheA